MYRQRSGPRAAHRQQEDLRIKESASLAERFPFLKSLTVDLVYYDSDGANRSSQIKYTANLAFAKSVFSFACPNAECVRGDFDLSEELARIVAARQKTATGEIRCQGWRSKTTIDRIHCHRILRYIFNLEY